MNRKIEKNINYFVLFVAGAVVAHVGHYLYQKKIIGFVESSWVAAFKKALSVIMCVIPYVLKALPWILIIIAMVIGCIIILKRKRDLEVHATIRRAKEIYAQADADSKKGKIKYEKMEKTLQEKYRRKEQILKEENAKRKIPYERELRKLKEEKIELKESIVRLMQAIKEKR